MTTAKHSVKARLATGDSLGCLWLTLGSPSLAEIAAEAKPDAIVLDCQHGLWDRRTLEMAIGLVRHRVSVMVRTADASDSAIGTALDAGAEGVIVPLIEHAETARSVVDAAHYPPRGRRSGGGIRPLADLAGYLDWVRENTFVAAMIETATGLENAAAIAATPGLDMVFIGTGDLALSLGAMGDNAEALPRAMKAIKDACDAAGTPSGSFSAGREQAEARKSEGFRLVVYGDDMTVTRNGFRDATASG